LKQVPVSGGFTPFSNMNLRHLKEIGSFEEWPTETDINRKIFTDHLYFFDMAVGTPISRTNQKH